MSDEMKTDALLLQIVKKTYDDLSRLVVCYEDLSKNSAAMEQRMLSHEALLKREQGDLESLSDRIIRFRQETLDEVKEFHREMKQEIKDALKNMATSVPVWVIRLIVGVEIIIFLGYAGWIFYLQRLIAGLKVL